MDNYFSTVRFQPDSSEGRIASITATLGAIGTVTTIAIPNWANGFRLYPDGEIKFDIGRDPQDLATASTTIALGDLGRGGYAKQSSWEVRLLQSTPSRELRLTGVAGGEVVDVEFF